MSQTLYRKYRSQTFAELVGQTSVTQILRNAIRRERLSHAYLFCGPRGTGKTSVARIFAKALCCTDPQDGDCCGKCENCLAIAAGNAVDVIEIDAASRNKVEDIRELRDKVGYTPIEYPYKIYIIDEVHMVTAQGFNALLKTLEEPPSHVKFLFATTEPHKLPITILSRCIRFDFQRIALDELANHLVWIAGEEGFQMDQDAAMLLARLAEGSARDAISLLDQLTVYCEDRITSQAAQELFQLGDPELAGRVLDMLKAGNRQELLQVWNGLVEQGADAGRFLVQLSEAIKQDYVARPDPRMREALSVMWEALNLLRFESFPALLVELSLLRCQDILNADADQQQVAVPVASNQTREPAGDVARRSNPAAGNKSSEAIKEPIPGRDQPLVQESQRQEEVRHARMPAASEPLQITDDAKWTEMLRALEKDSLTSFALLRVGVRPILQDGSLLLEFDDNGPGRVAARYALQEEHRERIAAAAHLSYGSSADVILRIKGTSELIPLADAVKQEPATGTSSATIGKPDDRKEEESGNLSAEDAMELFGARDIKDGD